MFAWGSGGINPKLSFMVVNPLRKGTGENSWYGTYNRS